MYFLANELVQAIAERNATCRAWIFIFYIQNLSFKNHSKHILGTRINVHFIVLVQPGLHRDGNNLNTVAHFSCCEDFLMTQSTIVLI